MDNTPPRRTPRRSRLYIDIDDTILARYLPTTFLEPRPAIVSQLRTLSHLFYCYWLTCWPWNQDRGADVKSLMRSGASDEEIAALIRRNLAGKWEGHEINSAKFVAPPRPMYSIGG